MNDLITYQFEEETVRVIMIGDAPWWVANDLCAVLAIGNPTMAMRRLDDDEKGVSSIETLGGRQSLNVVSESGMYSLVMGSRKEQAKRFKRWVTGEVLPSIRKTGKYVLHEPPAEPPQLANLDAQRLNAAVATVREARRLFGRDAAIHMWMQLGLPAPIALAAPGLHSDPAMERLIAYLNGKVSVTALEALEAIGARQTEKVCQMLHILGWQHRRIVGGRVGETRWFAPDHSPVGGEG